MGREKRPLRVAAATTALSRKVRRQNFYNGSTTDLVARKAMPKIKHHSYLEFVTNTDKKKKLKWEPTHSRDPPPGFEFVPTGDPELSTACKEISREEDVGLFVVSESGEANDTLGHHVTRIGLHVRKTVVDKARERTGRSAATPAVGVSGRPEPIPRSQAEINAQVDAALRDLFPRIPNTDREMIIQRSFQKDSKNETVGLQPDIPLSRRVQLAVVAHIRHSHTRYDELLREAPYLMARKAVEPVCLDYLVKWRGDEENGRDELDELVREVVVISDDEDDETPDESDSTAEAPQSPRQHQPAQGDRHRLSTAATLGSRPAATENREAQAGQVSVPEATSKQSKKRLSRQKQIETRRAKKGFKRYQAAWDAARDRARLGPQANPAGNPIVLDGSAPVAGAGNVGSLPQPVSAAPARGWSQPRGPVHGPPPMNEPTPVPGNGISPEGSAALAHRSRPGPAGLMPAPAMEYRPQQQPRGASQSQGMPIGHRLRDLLHPSVEPTPPETSGPIFVRPVSRASRPPELAGSRGANQSPGLASPTRVLPRSEGLRLHRRVLSDQGSQMRRLTAGQEHGSASPGGDYDRRGYPDNARAVETRVQQLSFMSPPRMSPTRDPWAFSPSNEGLVGQRPPVSAYHSPSSRESRAPPPTTRFMDMHTGFPRRGEPHDPLVRVNSGPPPPRDPPSALGPPFRLPGEPQWVRRVSSPPVVYSRPLQPHRTFPMPSAERQTPMEPIFVREVPPAHQPIRPGGRHETPTHPTTLRYPPAAYGQMPREREGSRRPRHHDDVIVLD